MKEYRAKLKRQIIWMTAGILFSCMVIVICCVSAVQLGADEHEASFMRGFQGGLFFAWAAIAVYGIVVNVRALRDDKRLRALYIKEHDERLQAIQRESGRAAYCISLFGLLTAAIAAGFFSMTVFAALIGAVLFVSVAGLGAKIWFHRTM